MKKLVLWSGGTDSTYLIYKRLKNGEKVDAAYVNLLNNDTKVVRELKAIKALKKIFDRDFPEQFIYHGVIFECDVKQPGGLLVFRQMGIWIQAIISCCSEFHEVSIGYSMGDDAISYLKDIKKTYKSYKKFQNNEFPKLTFPLKKISKSEIFDYLPTEIVKLITTCEGGDKKDNCGICHKCLLWKFYEVSGWIYGDKNREF